MNQWEGVFENPFTMPEQPVIIPSNKVKSMAYEEEKKIALVIDTNVLLKQTNLQDMLKISDQSEFDEKFDVYSLDEVIREVRDENTRNYISNGLPYPLRLKAADTFIEKSDMIHVENFAKDTGDFKSLSKVDKRVIALGIRLAVEMGEYDKLRKEPQPLEEFRPANFE